MTLEKNKILVLGIGNLLLNDEGVGVHIVNLLEHEEYTEADLLDGGTGGFHLLGFIQSYDSVVIADASLDEFPAGHVRVLHPKFAKDFPKQLSAHEIGLKDLLDAAFLLGNMPDIYLVAISIKEYQEMGTELTAEVKLAVPNAIKQIKLLVGSLLN
ncbi:MAG: hydrogenase maturation protease [Bacteroidales bacterium]|nr:hydrogenase maturation protease [Bacteroidales bacterium]